MYFFLRHLSFVDLCYGTAVAPQMLVNLLSKRKNSSFLGCVIQFHFFIALVITDYYILAVMAYDPSVVICKPFLYGSKMFCGVCLSLVAAPYTYGFANGLAQTILMLRLSFCGPNEITHFYCVDPLLLVLACSYTYVKETAMFVGAGFNLTCSLTSILIYIFISQPFCVSILEKKAQGFLHLWVSPDDCHYVLWDIVLHASETSVEQGKIVAVYFFNIFVSPMLSPLVYSIQNKDVKRALRKVIQRKLFTK